MEGGMGDSRQAKSLPFSILPEVKLQVLPMRTQD